MKIMHIAPRLSERGGADQFMLGLAEELSTRHNQVFVVGRKDANIKSSCPIHTIQGLDSTGLRKNLIDFPGMEELVRKHKPDLLHLHNHVHPEVIKWANRHACVLTIQDHRFFCPGRGKWTAADRPCKRPMDKKMCRGCFDNEQYFKSIMELTIKRLSAAKPSTIHVLSRYMHRELVSVGINPQHIHILAPLVRKAVPPTKPLPLKRSPYVLFLGRLVEAKGVWDAAEAWSRSGINLPLVFAGTGSERQRMEQRGLEVLGWQNRQQVMSLLEHASLLIFSPRWQEPFGIAGIEALCAGTSVAAWQSGAIAEWYQEGQLPTWGDIDSLSESIRRLCGKKASPTSIPDTDEVVKGMEAIYEIAMNT